MSKRAEQISKVEAKLKQLKAAEAQSAARQKAIATGRERKDELRRKILVGAVVLHKVASGELDRAQVWEWLDGDLKREDDRGLFKEWRNGMGNENGTPGAETSAGGSMDKSSG